MAKRPLPRQLVAEGFTTARQQILAEARRKVTGLNIGFSDARYF